MKILFVRTAGKISGAETYNIGLLKELIKHTSVHPVFLTNNNELVTKLERVGVESYYESWLPEEVGTKRQAVKLLPVLPGIIPRYIHCIRRLEVLIKFDAICLQSMTEKLILTPILKKLGYKIVWIDHGPVFVSRMSGILKTLYRQISRVVDLIIAVSEDTKRDLVSHGITPIKVKVVYIGIDTHDYAPLSIKQRSIIKEKLYSGKNVTVVGYVGTVTKEKGIDEYIWVANNLVSKSNRYRFLVIGDGPDLKEIKHRVERLGIKNMFTFTGYISDVKPFLGIMDFMVLPTRHNEGISMSILEAQAMGVPVITYNIGGNVEIIKNMKNGYISDNKRNIVTLISNLSNDGAELKKINREAVKTIRTRFNINKQTKRFVKLFSSL